MKLTYRQKRAILEHLADPGHWRYIFDPAFYDESKTNWKNKKLKHTTVDTHYKKPIVVASHKSNKSSLTLEKKGGNLLISDESVHHVARLQNLLVTDNQEAISIGPASTEDIGFDNPEADVFEVSDLDIIVRFDVDGSKSVFFNGLARRARFNALSFGDRIIPEAGFFHVIGFDADFISNTGMTITDFARAATMIIAFDMNIEPSLPAFNGFKEAETVAFMDKALEGFWDDRYDMIPNRFRTGFARPIGDISHLRESWTDTVDFTGHKLGQPKNFRVHDSNEGVEIRLAFDGRESALSQAAILQTALVDTPHPVETFNRANMVGQIIHLLKNGVVMTDLRDRKWSGAVVHSTASPSLANQARMVAKEQMGLSARHFTAINFDEGLCLMAMERNALEMAAAKSPAP